MKIKIVGDSASNLFTLDGVNYECTPLRIVTDKKEYVDTVELDVSTMVQEMSEYKS